MICLFMLLTLSVIGASSINTAVTGTKISGNVRDIRQGLFLAEAGISHGGEVLMENLSQWEDYKTPQSLISQTGLGGGSYQVTIEDGGGDLRRRMVSTARSPSGARTEIEAIVVPDYAPEDPGLFGCEGVQLDDNVTTQSYSSEGEATTGDKGHVGTSDGDAELILLGDVMVHGDAYSTGRLNVDGYGAIMGSGYANKTITLSGSGSIGNDAETGSICSGCDGRVAGSIHEWVSPPPVEITACDPLDIHALFMDEAQPVASDNDNAELSPSYYDRGDDSFFIGGGHGSTLGAVGEERQYYFSCFTADSDARVTVQGDVSLYVSGDCSILGHSSIDITAGATLTLYVSGEFFCDSNAQINNPGRPQDFELYSDYPSSDTGDFKLRLNSNRDLAALVYAPHTAIEVNSNANFFGALRGKGVYIHSGTSFWFDEDLPSLSGPQSITGFRLVLKRVLTDS